MAKINYCLHGIVLILMSVQSAMVFAAVDEFGKKLCAQNPYQCRTIKRTDTWSSLFPDSKERDLVKRVNRSNGFLKQGMIIAIPKKLSNQSAMDFSPFPRQLPHIKEKVVVIDQAQLAWGAYNDVGQLLQWGPISAGSRRCFESESGCETPAGKFYVTKKGGKDCYSRSYPKRVSGEQGGGYMPYCIFFHKGYALHGSASLPGYHASQGCVRLFISDARWLYHNFIDAPAKGKKGTKIIVLPHSMSFTQQQLDEQRVVSL